VRPDLDRWIADPALSIVHRGDSGAEPARLWDAARSVRLDDAGLLGRMVRWRVPGTSGSLAFDELFRRPPFFVLDECELGLVSGIAGPIWTLRRDYGELAEPEQFRRWAVPGTARVLFATWVEPRSGGGSVLQSEARVEPIGRQGRLGVLAVRPLVVAFNHLIASDGLAAAVRMAGSDGL
jgi:hypothetical protein